MLAVSIYINIAILPPALPRALFLYIAPLLVLLAVFSALFLYIQRVTDKARRVSVAAWRLVAFPSVSAFLSLLVAVYVGGDTPRRPNEEIGLPFRKFFSKNIFFIFVMGIFIGQ